MGLRFVATLCDDSVMAKRPTVVAIGEILWDVFPDGPHFGGAPANFACSVAELCNSEMDVFMVGSVGRDDLGRRAIELLKSHSVDTSCVSTAAFATGQVLVSLDEAGQPSFDIATETAWDYLAWSNELEKLAVRANAVCFGTLAQRSAVSRETIRKFVRATRPECLRILDINLRPPYWDDEVVRESFALANVLKCNDMEMKVLSETGSSIRTHDELIASLLDTHRLQLVAVTRGADGAALISAAGARSDRPGQATHVVDTVGAGDAFTAALAIGMLNGASLSDINSWANRVASFVCTQAGATPHFPAELRYSKEMIGR
jgi:fructokinase